MKNGGRKVGWWEEKSNGGKAEKENESTGGGRWEAQYDVGGGRMGGNCQIARLPCCPIGRLPNCPIAQLPDRRLR